MAELGLFPEPKILVLQGLVFLGALASANHFVIKPALRLFNERRRRTSGAVRGAKELEARAEALMKAYEVELDSKTVEAKELRLSEVLSGQAESEEIISRSIVDAKKILEGVESRLAQELNEEKSKIPALALEVSAQILQKLSSAIFLAFVLPVFLFENANAAGGGHVDTMDGIVWPMFQFLCFAAAVVFFGRKTMSSVLEKRRDSLRTQLSEAKQAVTLAERKASEYETKFVQLQKEVDGLRSQYVQDGIRERNKLVAEAQLAAANLLRDAQRSSNEMVAKAREQLKKDLVQTALNEVLTRLNVEKLAVIDSNLKKEALSKLKDSYFSGLN
jgi:F-type H+-transporting ATPase subunit b